jgi:hypothetical protein
MLNVTVVSASGAVATRASMRGVCVAVGVLDCVGDCDGVSEGVRVVVLDGVAVWEGVSVCDADGVCDSLLDGVALKESDGDGVRDAVGLALDVNECVGVAVPVCDSDVVPVGVGVAHRMKLLLAMTVYGEGSLRASFTKEIRRGSIVGGQRARHVVWFFKVVGQWPYPQET